MGVLEIIGIAIVGFVIIAVMIIILTLISLVWLAGVIYPNKDYEDLTDEEKDILWDEINNCPIIYGDDSHMFW